MLSPLNNQKLQILLFFLTCTIIIFYLNKNTNTFLNPKLPFNLRNLISIEDMDKRCHKASKNFLDKYNDTFSKELNLEGKPLNNYHEALIDIIGSKEYTKIKKYLTKIILYIIFVIIDIILIIVWFVLCGCCCNSKRDNSINSSSTKCCFLIFFLFSLIVILICVIGFFLTPCFYKSFNGVICSLYKLVFHFIEGTKNDFPISNWKGFEGIISLTEIYEQNSTSSNLPNINGGDCKSGEEELCKTYNDYKGKIIAIEDENKNFMNYLLNASDNIQYLSDNFIDIKDNILEEIENKMEYFDKYCKLGLFTMFCALLAFSLFGLLSLTAFFVCNFNCVKCLFHLFWNIEMLLIIVTMLIGVVFGVSGIVSKDIVDILKYAKSTENLNSSEPIIFNIGDYKQYIDICFNGDGDLSVYALGSTVISFDESNKENFEQFKQKYSEFNESGVLQNNQDLAYAYESLYEVMKNLKNLYDDLNKNNLKEIFDCKFIKYDLNILLNELNDIIAKKLVLFSLIIIVADLLETVAIIFGIFVARKRVNDLSSNENHGRITKIKQRDYGQNMDASSDNLRK